MTCELIEESGAYVLGILDADDRVAYERHLRTCAECQREVAEFSGLPALLAQIDPIEAASIGERERDVTPVRDITAVRERDRPYESDFFERADLDDEEAPPRRHLRPLPGGTRAEEPVVRPSRVQRGERRRQKRWRVLAAGLAAAACLALGVLVGTRVLTGPVGEQPNLVAMQKVSSSVPITAQVGLKEFTGGTQIRVHCLYDGGQDGPRWNLQLVVNPKNGAPQQVSTWTAAKGDDLSFSATTGYKPDEIASIEMRKADSTKLLVYQSA
jgi:anti-sigma-K factor RskA